MYFQTLSAYASLALAARAVLVPPNVSLDNLGDDNAMETLAINPFKRTVALECPGCAFASKEGDSLIWTQDTGNAFLLDFEVGPNEDTLDVDGVQLYPPTFISFTEPFYITQVDPHSDSDSDDALRLRVTGYTFHFNSAETVTEAGTELLPMTFRITAIEMMEVDVPSLRINLLKDVSGRLMIASFQTAIAEEASPIDQEKECNEWPLLCKWKSIIADKIDTLKTSVGKGCHKHKGNPMEQDGFPGKPPHVFRPGHPHHRPHHYDQNDRHRMNHHHHGAHNRVQMFFYRAVFSVLLPILVGIFAGTLTYLIGMVLGCAIAVMVARVRARGHYQRLAQEEQGASDNEDDRDGEKQVYAELPEYDAPPVYAEAAAEKEVVGESH